MKVRWMPLAGTLAVVLTFALILVVSPHRLEQPDWLAAFALFQ
ncbi:hypothetical protein [Alicyclobacillus sp. SO9]|nr:hypothetical protein [Alicyclobacillus sp. SO9]